MTLFTTLAITSPALSKSNKQSKSSQSVRHPAENGLDRSSTRTVNKCKLCKKVKINTFLLRPQLWLLLWLAIKIAATATRFVYVGGLHTRSHS